MSNLRETALSFIIAIAVSLSVASFTLAVELSDVQEERANRLFSELRCVVCQNQSIADSDADVARDLRQVVREKIFSGQSNSEVKSFLVSRYGEFVLLKPSFAPHTILLWLSPILFLLFGLYFLFRYRSPGAQKISTLSEEEKKELEKILSK